MAETRTIEVAPIIETPLSSNMTSSHSESPAMSQPVVGMASEMVLGVQVSIDCHVKKKDLQKFRYPLHPLNNLSGYLEILPLSMPQAL